MGPYLSTPDKTKHSEDGSGAKLRYGATGMQGWRNTMEDSHIAHILDESPGSELAVFGVFDGHGGNQVAEWIRDNFAQEMFKFQSYADQDYSTALKETFIKMDELLKTPRVKKELEKYSGSDGGGMGAYSMGSDQDIAKTVGCTACVCIITSKEVICANAGDSRAVLCKKGVAYPLSEDHKPENPDEKARIVKAGGFVEENRVKGMLNLSRALGDLEYKLDPDLEVEDQMISCVPEIKIEKIDKNTEFLIIACDGIWDCLTNQEACDYIHEQASILKKKTGSMFKCSFLNERMFDKIIAEDIAASGGLGCDNMTSVIISINDKI